MKTIYIECAMGAAGDMLMGALYELYPEKEKFLQEMNALHPGVTVTAERTQRQGIAGTHMRVVIDGKEERPDHPHDHDHDHHPHHHHEHRTLSEVTHTIDHFPLPAAVRDKAKAAYSLLAEAESAAHGVPVGEVHFHEVGAIDAVIDITGVCYLLHLLSPDKVCASPVTVGSGTVHTAHGPLPVPAPATAHLLTGIPVSTGEIASELCTPTGAVLLRMFAEEFGPMPAGVIEACGCGCGTKDFPRANCVRAFQMNTAALASGPNDEITELKANIDDMTGESLGYAMEKLLEAGAVDVSYAPVQMKKNRPGILLTCMCRPRDADRLAREILRQTTTFGVRRTDCPRYALSVTTEQAGAYIRKTGTGCGVIKSKPEFDTLASAADAQGKTLAEIREEYGRQ